MQIGNTMTRHRFKLALAAMLGAVLPPACVSGGRTDATIVDPDCVYDGVSRDAGESFPSTDGCNTCTCEASGKVACTVLACGGEPGCSVDGTVYGVGESFTLADDCNDCSCIADGEIVCTERVCSDQCELIQHQIDQELAQIQACEVAADCGQVLQGTSCGCTRNLVASVDADTAAFDDLLDEQSAAGCDVGGSTCDCPTADGFACVENRCTWNYVDQTSCEPVPPARLCVRGTVTDSGERLTADGPIQIVVTPDGCWSSSCTQVQQAECSIIGKGPFEVDAAFCLAGASSDGRDCTADCGGGGSATCETDALRTEGEHTIALGDLSVTVTVPSVLPFGGECDGSPF